MTVGIIVDFLWFPIGTDSFLYSFFSTICYRLEHLTNLAEYFITCDGKNLFDVLKAALKEAEVEQVDVRIEKV